MSDAVPTRGRLAGIDFGTVRIGIALSDPGQVLSSPHKMLQRGATSEEAGFFHRLVDEENVVGFVVGLPVHTSGDESRKSAEARRYGRWLGEVTGLPVCYYDERYTTQLAEQSLLGAELSRKKRKRRRDMVAAQVILAGFLESSRSVEAASLDDGTP